MSRLIVGVDPGAGQHGVAFYVNGQLEKLMMLKRIDLINEVRFKHEVLVSIEDVGANSALYVKDDKKIANEKKRLKKSNNVGMCQQACRELIDDLRYYNINFVLQPISSKWKGDRGSDSLKEAEKREFKMVTGSNEIGNHNTRSAAYMGYLAL